MMTDRNRSVPFTKMQAIGNDFIVIDGREIDDVDWSGLAIEICRRRLSIGSDGLLVIDRSSRSDAAMRMYNPDGTPDVCGNGLRCVARYLFDRTGTPDLTIGTLAGERRAQVREVNGECRVTVDMGRPRFAPSAIPMAIADTERVVDYPLAVAGERLALTVLSTGTVHSVTFVEELPGDERFLAISPLVEEHPVFPERSNLMWARVESRRRIQLRIWERGVGETLGCGTGACAAAVAARVHGLVDDDVTVASRGGEVSVQWSDGAAVVQTGPALYVFEGAYPLDSDGAAV